MAKVTAETVRQIADAIGIHPREERLEALAQSFGGTLGLVEKLDELNLAQFEPATVWRLEGGAVDGDA
jgi:Asp-tRNA(Asn)/Glu-tRNA(Gln) amidotransferase C subunit